MILINPTTLMHKSTLSTNNFGNNRFGQKDQKQNILRTFRNYNGICLKNFQRIEQKQEDAFLAKFSILLRISQLWKINNWNFTSSIDASDVYVTADIICRRKNFQKLQIYFESTKFVNQYIKIGF